MNDRKVDEYVRRELAAGVARAEIESRLLGVGWQKSDIENCFARVASSENPKYGSYASLFEAVKELNRRVSILEGKSIPAPLNIFPEEVRSATVQSEVKRESPSQTTRTLEEQSHSSTESKVTGKTFATVGVVAILFGVAFFLKFAFENGLIGELGRVILGIIAGVAFLSLGELASRKEKYLQYSFYLSGGGIAILYLSVYSAHWYYNLMSQASAFFAMILITATGVFFASKRNSIALAGLSLLGGLLTPELMEAGKLGPFAYLGYLLVLSVGFTSLSSLKKWPPIYYMGLVGTLLLSLKWLLLNYSYFSLFGLTVTMFTLLYCVYFVLPMILNSRALRGTSTEDIVGLLMSSLVYFGVCYSLFDKFHPNLTSTFFTIWALISLLLAFVIKRSHPEDNLNVNSYAALGLALLFLAVPIQFNGATVTMLWVVEGILMAALGINLKKQILRTFGFLVLSASICHLFGFVDLPKAGSSIFNEWFGIAVLTVFGLVFLGELFRKNIESLMADERSAPTLLTAVGLLLYAIAVQMQFLGSSVIFLLVVLGLGLIWLGLNFSRIELRIMGLFMIGQSLIYLLASGEIDSSGPLILNEYFGMSLVITLAIFLAGIMYRNKDSVLVGQEQVVPMALGIIGNILLAFTALRESELYFQNKINAVYQPLVAGDQYYGYGYPSYDYSDPAKRETMRSLENMQNLMRSIIIIAHSTLMMVVGLIWKYRSLRLLSIIGLGIVVFKVFLYDVLALSDLYRIISFITLGVILLVLSYLFYRYKDKIKEFVLS